MRSPYKKAKAAYILVWVLALLLIFFIWMRNGTNLMPSIISTLLSLAMGFFVSRLLENIITNTETTKRLGYLHMELDPDKFISSYSWVPEKTKGEKERMISYAYLSFGYEAKGDFKEALKTLEEGKIGGSDSMDTLYLSSKCRYLLEDGKIDESRETLNQLEKRIDDIKDNQGLKDNQRQVQYVLSERLDVVQGGGVDLEYLQSRLKETQYKIGRLEILSAIALYYKNTGKKKKEIETLNMIKEEGGDTWYTKWAEERLSSS